MRIISTLNNQKMKWLHSWEINEDNANCGIDTLLIQDGRVLEIRWLRYQNSTTLW